MMKIHGVSSSPCCILGGFYGHASRREEEFCTSSPKSNGSNSNVITRGFSSLARALSWPKAVDLKSSHTTDLCSAVGSTCLNDLWGLVEEGPGEAPAVLQVPPAPWAAGGTAVPCLPVDTEM